MKPFVYWNAGKNMWKSLQIEWSRMTCSFGPLSLEHYAGSAIHINYDHGLLTITTDFKNWVIYEQGWFYCCTNFNIYDKILYVFLVNQKQIVVHEWNAELNGLNCIWLAKNADSNWWVQREENPIVTIGFAYSVCTSSVCTSGRRWI